MWIDIFELPNGDIESVTLYWDKKICYESTFATEEGIDADGYVGDDDWGLGRHRIIEIDNNEINQMFMFILINYILKCDKKYNNVKIANKTIKEWLGDLK